MHKIFDWFRGEKNYQEDHHYLSSKRWKSSEKLRNSKFNKSNNGRNSGGGSGFVEHFDTVAIASTSSPANLAALGKANRQNNLKNGNINNLNNKSAKGLDNEYVEENVNNSTKNRIKSSFLSASLKHRKPQNVKKKRNNEFATTEDIPDPFKDCISSLDKKSKSANEMSQIKRPGFLQRIRLRLSSKSGINQEKRLNILKEQNNIEEIKVLKPHLVNEENKMGKNCQQQSKTETLQYQRSEEIDGISQKYKIKRKRENVLQLQQRQELIWRRQIASENGCSKVHFEGETEEEEAAFDADDEISNRLTTSSTINDSIYQLQRPNSSMSTSGTGPHHQRESIYFTVVQQPLPNHLSPPSTSPPERRSVTAKINLNNKNRYSGDFSPLIGKEEEKQNKQKQKQLFNIQRSKSQQLLTNKLIPSELLPDNSQNENDSPPVMQGSEPGSVKVSRRRLRFVIPQVSICSAEDRSSLIAEPIELLEKNELNNQQKEKQFLPPLLPQMFGGIGVAPEAEEELKRALSEMDRKELTLAQRRQSNLDVIHQASGRRTSTTLIPLTPAQIHLIRSLWRQVYLSKGPTVIGSQISHRLFFKEPQIREQFRRCPLPNQFVNHDSFSKAHCRHISELIDQIVENLDDLENVGAMLERIGRVHARISGGQLSSKIWNSVAETFVDCTLEWGDRRARSETVRKAWALIIAFIIERIKYGHLEEVRRRQITAIRSTIASLERFSVGGEGGNTSTISASSTPLSTPLATQRKQSNEILNDGSHLPVPVCPIRRVSASTTFNSKNPSSFSKQQNNNRNNRNNTISAVVANTIASIASPVASRRKVATTSAPLTLSPKTQQSPTKTRKKVMTNARTAGGRSSSDVQERRSDKLTESKTVKNKEGKQNDEKTISVIKHTNV
uniref:GLOBIN domain-containing protein n=1 Tax=Meloidogyne hapla TaxID=6305 RepID=A0A1I8BR08_MELHA